MLLVVDVVCCCCWSLLLLVVVVVVVGVVVRFSPLVFVASACVSCTHVFFLCIVGSALCL